MGLQLNTVSNDEHVPEIKRQIRTLKERTRAIYCTLPFRKIPRHLNNKMLYAANYWLNMFPSQRGDLTDDEPIYNAHRVDYELQPTLPT